MVKWDRIEFADVNAFIKHLMGMLLNDYFCDFFFPVLAHEPKQQGHQRYSKISPTSNDLGITLKSWIVLVKNF